MQLHPLQAGGSGVATELTSADSGGRVPASDLERLGMCRPGGFPCTPREAAGINPHLDNYLPWHMEKRQLARHQGDQATGHRQTQRYVGWDPDTSMPPLCQPAGPLADPGSG